MSYYRPRPSTHSGRSESSSSIPSSHRPSSRSQHGQPQDLKTLFQTLDNLLVLKASDGLAQNRYGKPNLNADIKSTMTTIKSHPRFHGLQHQGEFSESFLDIWAGLEELVMGWRDDDTRIQRLKQSEGVYGVLKRLRGTVFEGENAFASGQVEEEEYWW